MIISSDGNRIDHRLSLISEVSLVHLKWESLWKRGRRERLAHHPEEGQGLQKQMSPEEGQTTSSHPQATRTTVHRMQVHTVLHRCEEDMQQKDSIGRVTEMVSLFYRHRASV